MHHIISSYSCIGAGQPSTPHAQQCRVVPVAVPSSGSLPGTEYWQVEALKDYSRAWPSVKMSKGRLELRKVRERQRQRQTNRRCHAMHHREAAGVVLRDGSWGGAEGWQLGWC